MIFELYIFMQLIAVILLAACFVSKTPLISALTAFVSSILMVGSWVVQTGMEYVWVPASRAYAAQPVYVQTPYLPFINMLIFSIALIFFFYDVFIAIKEESEGVNTNVNLEGGGHGFKQ